MYISVQEKVKNISISQLEDKRVHPINVCIYINQQFSIINYKIGVKYTEKDTVSLLRSPVSSSYASGSINSSEADYINIHLEEEKSMIHSFSYFWRKIFDRHGY
jgi:hypothetical protein